METNLLEISLNEKSKQLLIKISSWAKIFFICTIITGVFDVVNTFLAYKALSKFSDDLNGLVKTQMLVNMIFLLLYAFLLPLQGYFYYSFARKAKKAVHYVNSDEMADSFNWLLKQVITASILFAMNSLWAAFIVYTEIKLAALYQTF